MQPPPKYQANLPAPTIAGINAGLLIPPGIVDLCLSLFRSPQPTEYHPAPTGTLGDVATGVAAAGVNAAAGPAATIAKVFEVGVLTVWLIVVASCCIALGSGLKGGGKALIVVASISLVLTLGRAQIEGSAISVWMIIACITSLIVTSKWLKSPN